MLTKSIAAKCNPKDHTPVKVAFAYEDDPAFRAAMETFHGVAGQLMAQFEFRDFWWRFDALEKPLCFSAQSASLPKRTWYFVVRAIRMCCRDWFRTGFGNGSPGAPSPTALLWFCYRSAGAILRCPRFWKETCEKRQTPAALHFSQGIIRWNTPNLWQQNRRLFVEKTWMSSA